MPPSPRSRPSLNLPRLYAIVDAGASAEAGYAPLDVARAFLSAGVTCLQLRAKAWPSGPFLELAQAVVAEARTAGCLVVVNDRADVARLCGAPGLHLGQDDLSPAAARRIVDAATVVGLSTHTRAQWQQAVDEPVSYLAIGPVYETVTKQGGYAAVGLDTVADAARDAGARGLPLVAIGGITVERAPAVIAAGAASVAVIGDLLSGPPEVRARRFLSALA